MGREMLELDILYDPNACTENIQFMIVNFACRKFWSYWNSIRSGVSNLIIMMAAVIDIIFFMTQCLLHDKDLNMIAPHGVLTLVPSHTNITPKKKKKKKWIDGLNISLARWRSILASAVSDLESCHAILSACLIMIDWLAALSPCTPQPT